MIRRLALLLALAAAPALAQTARTYVVQPGDTLFRISRAYGLTVEELRALNGLDDNYISVGQTLRVSEGAMPATPPRTGSGAGVSAEPIPDRPQAPADAAPRPAGPPTAPAGTVVHVVERGETLFRIALRYDTSVEELRRLNGITGDRIEVGQRLVVRRGTGGGGAGPAAPPRPWSITDTTLPADEVHFVEPGETLYSIAQALGFSVESLMRENPLPAGPLVPGTILRLPEPVNPAEAQEGALPSVSEEGLALVYPDVMRGRPTESGEPYDPLAFTASHRDLPFGTVLLVTNPASGRSTFVRVTDRGPVSRAYLVELSAAAATALELDPNAARRVELRLLP